MSGKIHRILNHDNVKISVQSIPVFVFHSVEPERFETQLRYLSQNGYRSVDSDSLLDILKNGKRDQDKALALTFDDATGSFWSSAFPILKKYKFKAILFAVPRLIPDEQTDYPNMESLWEGKSSFSDIKNRERVQPLCTWRELIKMHQSGIVDIQSHSLTHSRINISPRVVDFINPLFETYFFGNVNIPISRNDCPEQPLRQSKLGKPIYESASRLSGSLRFLENPSIGVSLVHYVEKNGGNAFFSHFSWRRQLKRKFRDLISKYGIQPEFESSQERQEAIRLEFTKSKSLLEDRLSGKTIRHFCYPWFQGSSRSDRIAGECNYQSVFYGLEAGEHKSEPKKGPFRVQRISEEYLFCLPGHGRQSISTVWVGKILSFAEKAKRRNQSDF